MMNPAAWQAQGYLALAEMGGASVRAPRLGMYPA